MLKTFYNKNFIYFRSNDSLVSMTYQKDGISFITKVFGNYNINYSFYPDLKIKSKSEFIHAISRMGTLQVGIEKEYDETGSVINEFNWDAASYDVDIPGPQKTIWEIAEQIKKDFNFDIITDNSLFGLHIVKDDKTSKVNYFISKLISDKEKILKTVNYKYDGDTGRFISLENIEREIPEGLIHY